MPKLVILIATLGLIIFLAVSLTFNFKDKLFSSLFPKPASLATGSGFRGVYESLASSASNTFNYFDKWDQQELVQEEISERLNNFKKAGFSDIFLYLPNRYAEAVRNPDEWGVNAPDPNKKCQVKPTWPYCQLATWDGLKFYIDSARDMGFKVHLHYSANYGKGAHASTERFSHPEWRVKYKDGLIDEFGLDFAYQEMQDYEKDVLVWLADTYRPDGIHIEEPYYTSNYATSALVEPLPLRPNNPAQRVVPPPPDYQEIPYNEQFWQKMKEKYPDRGYPDVVPTSDYCAGDPSNPGCVPCDSPPAGVPANNTNQYCQRRIDMHELKKEIINKFLTDVKSAIKDKYQEVQFSVTAVGYRVDPSVQYTSEGFDIAYWLNQIGIDFYSPQIYTECNDKSAVTPENCMSDFETKVKRFTDLWPNPKIKVLVRPLYKPPLYLPDPSPSPYNVKWLDELNYLDETEREWGLFDELSLRDED